MSYGLPQYSTDPYTLALLQQQQAQQQQQQAQQQQNPLGAAAGLAGMGAGAYAGNQLQNGFSFPSSLMGGAQQAAQTAGESSYVLPTSIGAAGPTYPTASMAGGIANSGYGASIMPYAAPLAALGIGAYTAAQSGKAYGKGKGHGVLGGAWEGLKGAGPLAAVPLLGQFPAIAGALGGMSTGKPVSQLKRDAVRRKLLESGFINPDYTITLPDGSNYDIGKDGNFRLTNEGSMPQTGESTRHAYDVDWSKKNIGDIVGALNPLAAVFADGDKKLTSDFAGYFTNAVTSSGDVGDNIRSLYTRPGLDRNSIYNAAAQMWRDGKIDENTRDSYFAAIDKVFGVENPTGARWTDPEGKPDKPQSMPQMPSPGQSQFLAPKDTNVRPSGSQKPSGVPPSGISNVPSPTSQTAAQKPVVQKPKPTGTGPFMRAQTMASKPNTPNGPRPGIFKYLNGR